MKKLAVLFSIIILCITSNAYAKETANIPACSVTLSGQSVDNSYRQYPLLQYKDIVYFPMTYYDCRFLGVSTNWDSNTNTLEITKENISGAYRDYIWEWENAKKNEISICNFNIVVNGKEIDNKTEEYPLITFRDVTYFPLTWRFAVDEFGWEYSYDDKNGLVVNADNYICEELLLPDMRTDAVSPCITDGKYYYYRGNANKIYRAPVDMPIANELIFDIGENVPVGLSYVNGNVYFNYRTGGATMGTDHRYKINPDGSVEQSDEDALSKSGLGYNISYIKSDKLTVTTVNQVFENNIQMFYASSDTEISNGNYGTEIKLDGVRFGEKKHPDREIQDVRNAPQILGTNIYLTGYTAEDTESRLYKVDTLTGEITPLIENVQEFHAFVGWDNDTKSNSDMFIYVQDGKLIRYSTTGNTTYVIEENSLPLKLAAGNPGYVVTGDDTKSLVIFYDSYGIGSVRLKFHETTLPTDYYVTNGILYGRNLKESPDEDIHTIIFNGFKVDSTGISGFFRSSDIAYNIFISDDTLIYSIWDSINRVIKVDLSKGE